jgi:hypothetical protein
MPNSSAASASAGHKSHPGRPLNRVMTVDYTPSPGRAQPSKSEVKHDGTTNTGLRANIKEQISKIKN